MKNITINSILICFIALASALQVHGRTLSHDFGTIDEKAVATHQFVIPAAKKQQVIVRTNVTCPCTKVDYPRRPVPAGQPVKINLRFDPSEQKNGHFTKTVYVYYGDNRRDTLVVTGTVKRQRPRVDTEGYPHDLGLGFRMKTRSIDFGTMRPGQTKTLEVPMMNGYENVMPLNIDPSGAQASWLKIPYGMKLRAGQRATFKIILTIPADARPGSTPDLSITPSIFTAPIDPIPVRVKIR